MFAEHIDYRRIPCHFAWEKEDCNAKREDFLLTEKSIQQVEERLKTILDWPVLKAKVAAESIPTTFLGGRKKVKDMRIDEIIAAYRNFKNAILNGDVQISVKAYIFAKNSNSKYKIGEKDGLPVISVGKPLAPKHLLSSIYELKEDGTAVKVPDNHPSNPDIMRLDANTIRHIQYALDNNINVSFRS